MRAAIPDLNYDNANNAFSTKSEPFTVKKILVPTDFSEASNIAFRYALCFFQQFGAELDIIHVLGPTISPHSWSA